MMLFLSFQSALRPCELECKGHDLFISFKKKYGRTPKLAHYACMVDLLIWQGNVEEALEFETKCQWSL
ncbi:hypothetical protein NC652_006706 [Populus alba x Populus x berolinensis]|uniref:Uncharacterized protein n=2 Tax=Populus alba x Populus x berolinensis TaxID=444605 RepID=A0AAD6REY8_9ROSI|nr:hypothetical protein NC652_006706 [Populus alba x Populus x berolinensis]KAJ7007664.1 hypothetical protein NC653_006637 [Populus alba x Populus x berolinensis]